MVAKAYDCNSSASVPRPGGTAPTRISGTSGSCSSSSSTSGIANTGGVVSHCPNNLGSVTFSGGMIGF
ncbi:MAG: hypothetical protein WAZ77_01955 [Candidatus Nitrosopolaris sp.]